MINMPPWTALSVVQYLDPWNTFYKSVTASDIKCAFYVFQGFLCLWQYCGLPERSSRAQLPGLVQLIHGLC